MSSRYVSGSWRPESSVEPTTSQNMNVSRRSSPTRALSSSPPAGVWCGHAKVIQTGTDTVHGVRGGGVDRPDVGAGAREPRGVRAERTRPPVGRAGPDEGRGRALGKRRRGRGAVDGGPALRQGAPPGTGQRKSALGRDEAVREVAGASAAPPASSGGGGAARSTCSTSGGAELCVHLQRPRRTASHGQLPSGSRGRARGPRRALRAAASTAAAPRAASAPRGSLASCTRSSAV